MERPIFLTVGGRPFTVLASTLTMNSTYFKTLEDKLDGSFIPRDAELFDHCLRFLYGNREFISELSTLTQWSLWREAEFYQMKELCDVLQGLLRPEPSVEDLDAWKMQSQLIRSLLLSMWPHVKRMYEEILPALEPIGHVLFEQLNDQTAFHQLWHYIMSSDMLRSGKNRRRPEETFQALKVEKEDPTAAEGLRIFRSLTSRIGLALIVAMFAQRVDDAAPGPAPPGPAPPGPAPAPVVVPPLDLPEPVAEPDTDAR